MARVLGLLLLIGLAAASAALAQAPTGARAAPLLHGWDEDGVPIPFDRCPDRGRPRLIDNVGCPLARSGRWGDLDGDHLVNGRGAAMPRTSPLAVSLIAQGIVHGTTVDGRVRFLGEDDVGTDPLDPNTDKYDILGDGYEAAMRFGLARAGRAPAQGGELFEPPDVHRADPTVPDDYLEVRPAIIGTTTYWNEALDAALRQIVEDDAEPEASAAYTPPAVRLHIWREPSFPLADANLTFEEVPDQVRQHLNAARRGIVTYVIVAPTVSWHDADRAGLASEDVVLVAVAHKGFEACEEEGGRPGTPACDELTRLFRWTLNHERMHRWGLPDRDGDGGLMSTAPGVYKPRPWESAQRFAWFEENPDRILHDWDR